MDRQSISLFVFYEGPFWVGVFERTDNRELQAAKITFGAEPQDAQVHSLICEDWTHLHFTDAVASPRRAQADSPKRRQRAAAQAVSARGAGTKSQLALSAQREQSEVQARSRKKERRAELEQRRFEDRQRKRKQKHRGH